MVTYFQRLTGVSLREMFAVKRVDLAAYRMVFDPLLRLRSTRSSRR